MNYQQILDENGNVLTENGNVPNLQNFDIKQMQIIIDSINHIHKNNSKLIDEFDFKELDTYKNNVALNLLKSFLGNKYNDGFGVFLLENYKFIKLVEDIKEDLKIEKTDESLIISSGNEKIFEKRVKKYTEHSINDKTIKVGYNIFDTFYEDGVAYNFFENKMTFDGNEMLFDEKGLCLEGTFVMDSEDGIKTKKVVRNQDDISLVHVDYFNDGQLYNSEDRYLATLEKINSEAQYNEKCDKETYMRRIEKNLYAFPNLKNEIIEKYQIQNSKNL